MVNKLLVLIIGLCLITTSAWSRDTVDGYEYDEFELSAWAALLNPPVSATNTARIYYNGVSDQLMLSENGGAYSPIATHSSASAAFLKLDASNSDDTYNDFEFFKNQSYADADPSDKITISRNAATEVDTTMSLYIDDASSGMISSDWDLSLWADALMYINADSMEIDASVGYIYISPSADTNVELFTDNNSIGNADDGKKLIINRDALEGDNAISFYIDNTQLAHIVTDATTKIHTTADDMLMYAETGTVRLQPYAHGPVSMFGLTDVADADDGKSLYINRMAAEGDSYLQIYCNDDKEPYIVSSTGNINFDNENLTTTGSVGIGGEIIQPLTVVVPEDIIAMGIRCSTSTAGKYTGIRFKAAGDDGGLYFKGGVFFERKATNGRGYLHLSNNYVDDNTNATVATAMLSLKDTGIDCYANNITTTGTISYGETDWTGGNVTYVPLTGDIGTYITNATAGDTLVLASGTYTITSDINIAKAINIIGQGRGKTVIACSTSVTAGMIYSTSDNVTLQDFSMTVGGTVSRAIYFNAGSTTVFSNCNIFNVDITGTTAYASLARMIQYTDAGGTIRNVYCNVPNTVDRMFSLYKLQASTAEASNSLYVYDSYFAGVTTAGGTGRAIINQDSVATQNSYLYLYNTTGIMTGLSFGVNSLGDSSFTYAYNSTFSGGTYDVVQSTSAVMQLTNCSLLTDTTDGTITYDGRVVTESLMSPTIIGGTATTSDLYLQTTSGVGVAGADMHFLVGDNGGTEAMTILNSGFAGIGVVDPNYKLEIEDTSGTLLGIRRLSETNAYTAGFFLGVDTTYYKSEIAHVRGTGVTNGMGSLKFAVDSNDDAANVSLNTDVKMVITSAGLVGIGIDPPTNEFHVKNTGQAVSLGLESDANQITSIAFIKGAVNKFLMRCNATNYSLDFYSYGTASAIMTMLYSNGFVGIGTDSPTGIIHTKEPDFADSPLFERVGPLITSDTMYASTRLLTTKANNMGDGFGTAFSFNIQDDAGVINNIGLIGAVRDGADNTGAFVFKTITAGGASTERFRIGDSEAKFQGDSYPLYLGAADDYSIEWNGSDAVHTISAGDFVFTGGNVGIGTASPSATIHCWNLADNTDARLRLDTYDTSADYYSRVQFVKSNSETKGIYTETDSGDILGMFQFLGVDSTSAVDNGAVVKAVQDGACGVKVPTNLVFETYSSTAVNTNQFVLHNGSNVGIGTANPTETLEVNGGIEISGAAAGSSNGLRLSDESGYKMIQAYNSEQLRINPLGNAVVFGDKVCFTQTDENEYIDSLADGYLDLGATTAIRLNSAITRVTGDLYVGNNADADPAIVFDGDTSDGQITYYEDTGRFLFNEPISLTSGALLGSPVAGTFEFYNDRMYLTNVATQRVIDRTSDVATSTVTVSNTTDETTVFTGAVPAGSLKAGNILKLNMSGDIDETSAADLCTIKVYFGATEMASIVSPGAGTADQCWDIKGYATLRSVGGAGSMAWMLTMQTADGNAVTTCGVDTVDTTAAEDVTVTVTWNNAKVGNIFNLYQGFMEYKN